jgi:hypothetical protein
MTTPVKALIPGEAQENDDPTGWKTAREFIGMWKDAPEGVSIARDHDKYLYGDE